MEPSVAASSPLVALIGSVSGNSYQSAHTRRLSHSCHYALISRSCDLEDLVHSSSIQVGESRNLSRLDSLQEARDGLLRTSACE